VRIGRALEPVSLRGESVVDSWLLSGPTEDLNVMSARPRVPTRGS
jgi:environmental stress-induced protein Ves